MANQKLFPQPGSRLGDVLSAHYAWLRFVIRPHPVMSPDTAELVDVRANGYAILRINGSAFAGDFAYNSALMKSPFGPTHPAIEFEIR